VTVDDNDDHDDNNNNTVIIILKKVKLSLYSIKHYAVKTYGGVDVNIHVFMPSALGRGEWSVSRRGRFTPRERTPGTHWIGGWVCPRAGLNAVKRRIFCPCWESNPNSSAVQPVAHRYTD
jgi:hypothetical protein